MEDRTCKECNELFNDAEQLRRHLRKHGITFQQYALKWFHNNIIPKCKCGCNNETSWNVAFKGYTEFVHGHHAFGRKKSDDEKRKIGDKNSVNMKQYMKEHPDVAKLRGKQLRSTWTDVNERNRIVAVKQAYTNMSDADKSGFKDRTKQRWSSGEMVEPHKKAAETFKKRSQNGDYDFTERNQKLSKSITKKYLEGGFEWSRGKYVSTKTNKECYYRSSWELVLMKQLDEDPDVLDWESEFTSMPYMFEGAEHKYVPDLHVIRSSTGHSLIEVKPQALRIIPKNAAKREVAKRFCEERGWSYVEWEP